MKGIGHVLKTSVERLDGHLVRLTVMVPAEEVDAAIERTYRQAASKVRVPGFRPGKAPKPILDSMLGREHLLAEATEAVVNSTYSKALDLENLRPIESPELDELDVVKAGEAFTYSAEIEVRPELTVSSTEGITVALPSAEVTDEEVDAYVEQLRERFATLEPVEGRAVELGDFVLLSFVGLVDGEPYEGNEVDRYLYETGRGLMPEAFDAGLIGLEPGGQGHIEFDIPETATNAEFAGKRASFEVTVHEIKAKVLPELDDAFAMNVGGFDTLEELRQDLRNRISVQKNVAREQAKERAARAALAERLEGEVPEAMIVQRQASMTRDFMTMLEDQGLNLPGYLDKAGIDMDRFEADMRERALESLREELALEALFRTLGMEISEEDVEAEFNEIAAAANETAEKMRARWEELGLMPVLKEQIMQRKAVRWLLDNVEVTDAPQGSEE